MASGGAVPAGSKLEPGDPSEIGPYHLLSCIVRGETCTVYLAEQREPIYRRVLVKSLRSDHDRPYVRQQFQSERQALANIQHDYVPKLLDAGSDADGLPYLVMEATYGDPIDVYCDRTFAGIEERVRLMAEVCRGVQRIHSAGVLHRDLQPENILVRTEDDRAVPLIIDFSLAQTAGEGHTEVHASMLDTPAHISPELLISTHQADARADVYALGAVLYELLTGKPPFGLLDSIRERMKVGARGLASEPPPPPSQFVRELGADLESIALARRLKPSELSGALYGDLDHITTKAMQPDRSDRYQSARQMAEDLHRHLRHEPLSDGAATHTGVRVQKALRRNRAYLVGAICAAVLFVGALLIWGGGEDRPNVAASRAGGFGGNAPRPAPDGASPGSYRADYARSFALLIGTSYDRQGAAGFGRLPNAEADVAAMRARLGSLARKWEITSLTGVRATRRGILDALGRLRDEAAPDDRILIYFAGHGDRLEDTEHSAWIIPDDAAPRATDAGRSTWIRFDEFLNFFDEVKAKHVMLALDCCYSGRIVPMRSGGATEFRKKYLTRKARLVVASGRANDQVPDGKAGTNSPFTQAFLSALTPGEARALTGTSLFAHIQTSMQGSAQTPGMTYIRSPRDGGAEGEFIFFLE